MKKICIALLTTCVFVSCAQGGSKENEIVIDENTAVIDVRTEQEYKAGHLKNSINITYGEIKDKIKEPCTRQKSKNYCVLPQRKKIRYCKENP